MSQASFLANICQSFAFLPLCAPAVQQHRLILFPQYFVWALPGWIIWVPQDHTKCKNAECNCKESQYFVWVAWLDNMNAARSQKMPKMQNVMAKSLISLYEVPGWIIWVPQDRNKFSNSSTFTSLLCITSAHLDNIKKSLITLHEVASWMIWVQLHFHCNYQNAKVFFSSAHKSKYIRQ